MAKKKKKGSSARARSRVGKVMREFKQGKLRGGKGRHPKVTSRKQAIAIGLSEARRAGAKIPKKKAKRAKKRPAR